MLRVRACRLGLLLLMLMFLRFIMIFTVTLLGIVVRVGLVRLLRFLLVAWVLLCCGALVRLRRFVLGERSLERRRVTCWLVLVRCLLKGRGLGL